jgi:3-dehydroquinate synthase
MTVPMRVVDVGGAQPYSIAIGPGLLETAARSAAHVRGRHVLVVSDTQVAPLYRAALAAALQARCRWRA